MIYLSWYQGNTDFKGQVRNWLLLFILKKFEKDCCKLIFKVLVAFSSEDLCSWTLLWFYVFNCIFNLFSCYEILRFSISSGVFYISRNVSSLSKSFNLSTYKWLHNFSYNSLYFCKFHSKIPTLVSVCSFLIFVFTSFS